MSQLRMVARIPRFTIFNHKGGVGKTTLTANLAFALSAKGIKTLVVDGDPQGNLTSYLLEDDVVNDLLDNSDSSGGRTLWSALKPVSEGTGAPQPIEPYDIQSKFFLVPGDVRLAEFEAELSDFWTECFARRVRGLRGTQSLSAVVSDVAAVAEVDLVLYDSGPNVGPLTRVMLLDSDFFAIPAAWDLFSTRAVKTLGHILERWIRDWMAISSLFPPELITIPGQPRLIGYIPQQFRIWGGAPTSSFADMMPAIERAVSEDVVARLASLDQGLVAHARSPLKLPEIRSFGGAASAAQTAGQPLWLAAGMGEPQRRDAEAAFSALADAVIDRVGLSND
jgi:cellulose biosynthesis protein BcsQ